MIVNGFFEWYTAGKNKYPHFIRLKDQDFFSMGGIYETWVNRDTAEIFNTFSILTVEANPMMAKIHNIKKRMPFILTQEDEMNWITPGLSKDEITNLIKPADENAMAAWTISKRITDRNLNPNVPEVTDKFEYPELALNLWNPEIL